MFDWIKRWTKTEHERVQEDLSAFLDGQLTPRERSRVERHLQACAACRAELDSLRQTVALLHTVPAVRLPRSFLLPVGEARQQRQVQRRRLAYVYLQAATAVATVLLVLVVSGDALLRYQASQPAYGVLPAKRAEPKVLTAPTVLDLQVMEASPTAALEGAPETPAPTAPARALGGIQVSPTEAAAQSLPEVPTPTAPLPLAAAQEAAATETTQAVAAERMPAPEALPSQTFERSATFLPVVSATGVETATEVLTSTVHPSPEVTATTGVEAMPLPPSVTPSPTDTPLPPIAIPLPTDTPVPPTATPSPTSTPLPPTATPEPSSTPVLVAEMASPQPEVGQVPGREQLPPPAQPAAWWALLEPVRPVLPWVERVLGVTALALLGITLLLRRGQRRM